MQDVAAATLGDFARCLSQMLAEKRPAPPATQREALALGGTLGGVLRRRIAGFLGRLLRRR
jgi:hypothetical protein